MRGASTFKAQLRSLEVIHLADGQMPPEVDCGKHAEEFEGIDAANHADVELAVIHLRVGRDLHPAAVSGSIGESRKDCRLVAASSPATSFVGRQDLHGKRGKAKDRGSQ